jgi:SAM-dependent methyltransferase
MYAEAKSAEFSGRRSATYRDALSTYANAWRSDIACMERFLDPRPGERILEIGAGNGYFSRAIADRIGKTGLLVATDPSTEQLSALGLEEEFTNLHIVQAAAETLDIPYREFDAVWSRGAVHHVADKTSAFTRFAQIVRPGGRLVIADIFAGTRLATYFDGFIARSCCTGHEVAFLSREFAESLCDLTGWRSPRFHDVITPWEFSEREQIGQFLHLLFSAKDAYSPQDCLDAADRYLSVTPTAAGWALMWPMTVMVADRANHA